MTATDLTISLAGESVALLPERALYWPRLATLIVADLHWGKADTFRAASIPIPGPLTDDDLARLATLITRTNARRVVVLGDLLHARAGRTLQTLAAVEQWRATIPNVDLLLVRGNHDTHAGDPPAEWRIECVDAPYPLAPFVLAHHPAPSPDGYVLAGHLHPAVNLRGRGDSLRLPCFWFGNEIGVLPSFGSFTGSATIRPNPADRVFVIAGSTVLSIPTL